MVNPDEIRFVAQNIAQLSNQQVQTSEYFKLILNKNTPVNSTARIDGPQQGNSNSPKEILFSDFVQWFSLF